MARVNGRGVTTTAPPNRWTARRRCSSSIPAARPANPRASCTPRPATISSPRRRPSGSSTSATTTSTGARPTWAGSRAIPMWSTGRCRPARRSSCTKGPPTAPDCGRWWQMIEKHRVSILYTAPTAIRTFIKWGDHWLEQHDLSSLRLLGQRGRGHQSRGLDVVSREGRRRPLPDRRYLVADGDRRRS